MQVTKFNLVTDLKIMLSNVTHSHFYCECNKERGPIDQLYIELGTIQAKGPYYMYYYCTDFSLLSSTSRLACAVHTKTTDK